MTAMIGKYQIYYTRIAEEVKALTLDHGYSHDSKAFAHWFFQKKLKLDDFTIGEILIDGTDDNGIDGIIFNEQEKDLALYQFKFPSSEKQINKDLDESTILKLLNGYKKLTSARTPRKANSAFLDYRKIVKEKNIFTYRFIFVLFINGLGAHAKETLESQVSEIEENTGNKITYEVIDKNRMCDIYDQIYRKIKKPISLKYTRLETSFNLANIANSWTGFCKAEDILTACEPVIENIFDENIRLSQGPNTVNDGIRATAKGPDSQYFYFFHNGIVFICDKCDNSTGNQVATLAAASIVNGCQTISVLRDLAKCNELKNDVHIPIRIIQTQNFTLRSKITEFLNRQTEIRDSYFLANNSFIISLQEKLLAKGYFLERQINEYSYRLNLGQISEFDPKKILVLEKIIQRFVGYSNNESAAIAKRGKGELFDKDAIDSFIAPITADKVIEIEKIYQALVQVISSYRKSKRSNDVLFLQYVGITVNTPDEIRDMMNEYQFLTTGDILLLNTIANLKKIKQSAGMNELILESIIICHDVIKQKRRESASSLTKNREVFSEIQNRVALMHS